MLISCKRLDILKQQLGSAYLFSSTALDSVCYRYLGKKTTDESHQGVLIATPHIGREHKQLQQNTATLLARSRGALGGKYVGEAEATMTDFNRRGKQIVKKKKKKDKNISGSWQEEQIKQAIKKDEVKARD